MSFNMNDDFLAKIGYAGFLISMCDDRLKGDLGREIDLVIAAVESGTIKFYFDEDGDPVGFLIWALLSEESRELLLCNRLDGSALRGLKGGKELWILDMVIPKKGYFKYIARDIRSLFAPSHEKVNYVRLDNHPTVPKSFRLRGIKGRLAG